MHWLSVVLTLRRVTAAVWLPTDEEPGNLFGYSIGVYYLFNEPEILVIHRGTALSQRQVAMSVNYFRTACQLEGKKIKRGATLGEFIDAFPDREKASFAPFKGCRFSAVTDAVRKAYFGFGMWFNCNFGDCLDFPAFFIELEAEEKDDEIEPEAVEAKSPRKSRRANRKNPT